MANENEEDIRNSKPPPAKGADAAREVDVRQLLGAEREAVLVHGGERYRLRITASGKLILTK